jgi:hypothetical protein
MRIAYLQRSLKRFLAGTNCKTPIEAVESGRCSLADWSRILSEERELEQQRLVLSKHRVKHQQRRSSSDHRGT